MRSSTLLQSFLFLGLATSAQAAQVAGYGLNGTRIYPDCKPPTTFNLPKDLRWEFRFNGWGNGSPIVVGDQVLAIIEATPACDWPQLISVDLKTGKERWRAVLDAAEAVADGDAAKRKTITDDWHLFRLKTIKNYRFREAFRQNPEKAKKDWEAEGGTYTGPDHKPRMEHPCYEPAAAARSRLEALGITVETWHEHRNQSGIDSVGHAYATPVSDGQTVYITTSEGMSAAFDLTGKRKWLTRVRGKEGEYCCNGRSPILWTNPTKKDQTLLLSDITNMVRAIDAATGKLLWSDAVSPEKSHTIVTPMVLTVGGKDVLWAAGCQAYLLPEGKKVTVDGWKDEGMQTLVKHDEKDVVFFCGSGEHCGWTAKGDCPTPPPAAVRFAWAGETLKANVLWSGINGKAFGGNLPWMVYDQKKFYCPGKGAVDALTGKILFGDFVSKRYNSLTEVPRTSHLLQVANGHIYGLTGAGPGKELAGGAHMDVCTLDGKGVAMNLIPPEVFDKTETEAWNGCALYYNIIGRFAHGWAFTFSKDAIIVRSNLRMYCIGPK